MLLDPKGRDLEVDIATYRNAMREWIEDIRFRKYVSLNSRYRTFP
jgi:hypothetical protein